MVWWSGAGLLCDLQPHPDLHLPFTSSIPALPDSNPSPETHSGWVMAQGLILVLVDVKDDAKVICHFVAFGRVLNSDHF